MTNNEKILWKNLTEEDLKLTKTIFQKYRTSKKLDEAIEDENMSTIKLILLGIICVILSMFLGYATSWLLTNFFVPTFIGFLVLSVILTINAYSENHDKNIINNYNMKKLINILDEYSINTTARLQSLINLFSMKQQRIIRKNNIIARFFAMITTVSSILGIFIKINKFESNDVKKFFIEFNFDGNTIMTMIVILVVVFYFYRLIEYKSNRLYYDLDYLINDLNELSALSDIKYLHCNNHDDNHENI